MVCRLAWFQLIETLLFLFTLRHADKCSPGISISQALLVCCVCHSIPSASFVARSYRAVSGFFLAADTTSDAKHQSTAKPNSYWITFRQYSHHFPDASLTHPCIPPKGEVGQRGQDAGCTCMTTSRHLPHLKGVQLALRSHPAQEGQVPHTGTCTHSLNCAESIAAVKRQCVKFSPTVVKIPPKINMQTYINLAEGVTRAQGLSAAHHRLFSLYS